MIKSNVSESRSHSLHVSCSYSHYNVELCTLENYSIMQIRYVYHLCLYLLYLFLYQQLKQYKMFCFQLFWLIENFKIKAVNKMLWPLIMRNTYWKWKITIHIYWCTKVVFMSFHYFFLLNDQQFEDFLINVL